MSGSLADEIKRIFVRIGGMSYQLVSAENENYTRQIAAKADEMIRRVMQNNPQLSLNMSTVLALVNSLDELSRLYLQLNTADSQKHETEKQAAESRKELNRLREQNWEMKKEILRLSALCKDYEALLEKATAAETPAEPEPAAPAEGKQEPVDFADEWAAIENMNSLAETPIEEEPAGHPAAEPGETLPESARSLTQTNFEDYLRESGWQTSAEQQNRHE